MRRILVAGLCAVAALATAGTSARAAGPDPVHIRNVGLNACLAAHGSQVLTEPCAATPAQEWEIGAGDPVLIRHDGQCLIVQLPIIPRGPVALQACGAAERERWIRHEVSAGTDRIISNVSRTSLRTYTSGETPYVSSTHESPGPFELWDSPSV